MVLIAGEASRFAMKDVLVAGAALDTSGLRVVRLVVGDEADDSPPLAADERPSPAVSAAFQDWAAQAGSPAALPNIYVPAAPRMAQAHGAEALFTGQLVDEPSRRYLTASTVARALRIRARTVHWLAMREVIDAVGAVRWTSFLGGPAFPLVSAIVEAGRHGVDVEATFVDASVASLDATRRVALAHGVDPGTHRFLTREQAVATEPLAPESQDLVEALALLDGRTLEEAAVALPRAFALVRPGGSLVFSALLADRPGADADSDWPAGWPCTLDDIATLLDAAGIPVLDAMVHVGQDGAFAVVEITRL